MHRVLTALVVVAGLSSLALATDGFQAITTEGARRLEVGRSPRALPQVTMVDHLGRSFGWADFAGHPVLVEFIFTSCPDVCQKMSSDLGAVVRDEKDAGELRFLSLSFDPERDTVDQLRSVAQHYGADGERWRFARISDAKELADTLGAFGIVAVPSPERGFEHNVALHGLNARGELGRIADIDDAEEMVQWALAAR